MSTPGMPTPRMPIPGTSEVHVFQYVQKSSGRLIIASGGTTEAKIPKEIMNVEELLSSQLSEEGTFNQNEDIVAGRGYRSGDHGIEQRIPGTYEVHEPLPDSSVSGGGPDTNVIDTFDRLYQRLPENPESDQGTCEHEGLISTLTSRLDVLTTENEHLKKALEQTAEETTELTSKLNNAMKERDDLGRQRQTNLLKIRRLNDMIIKGGQNSDEPLDDEVLQEMYKVRNLATDIIKRFYPGEALAKPDVVKAMSKRGDPYYFQYYKEEILTNKNPERRRRLLIALLFIELQFQFFGPNARRYGLPKYMETSFQGFEKMIEESTKVTTEESLEWRTNTVAYAGRLNTSFRETVDSCANHFLMILQPMVLQSEDKYSDPDKREIASLLSALQDLCSASLKLALRFRSSKTKYEFKSYPDRTSLAACDEELIKKLNSEGPISKPMDPNKLRIFCTLFGALVKTRPPVSGQASEPVVLEAGHVIVYEP